MSTTGRIGREGAERSSHPHRDGAVATCEARLTRPTPRASARAGSPRRSALLRATSRETSVTLARCKPARLKISCVLRNRRAVKAYHPRYAPSRSVPRAGLPPEPKPPAWSWRWRCLPWLPLQAGVSGSRRVPARHVPKTIAFPSLFSTPHAAPHENSPATAACSSSRMGGDARGAMKHHGPCFRAPPGARRETVAPPVRSLASSHGSVRPTP